MKQQRMGVLRVAALKLAAAGMIVAVVALFAQAGASQENAQRQHAAAAVAADQLTDRGEAYQALKAAGIENTAWATLLSWGPVVVALGGVGYAAWVVAGTARQLKGTKKKEIE